MFELRYAGRRLVDALAKRETEPQAAIALLKDAKFDCHRARHDAIDAATSKMVGDINAAVEYLSASVVLSCYPEFTAFFAQLQKVRRKIAASREDRDNRDLIYEAIQNDDLEGLVAKYDDFMSCEELMISAADENRSREKRNNIFGWGGLLFGLIGIAVSIVLYIMG